MDAPQLGCPNTAAMLDHQGFVILRRLQASFFRFSHLFYNRFPCQWQRCKAKPPPQPLPTHLSPFSSPNNGNKPLKANGVQAHSPAQAPPTSYQTEQRQSFNDCHCVRLAGAGVMDGCAPTGAADGRRAEDSDSLLHRPLFKPVRAVIQGEQRPTCRA